MYEIKLMSPEDILKDSNGITQTLQRAFDKCGLHNGWTPQDIVLSTLRDPANFHIWVIKDSEGVAVAYGSTRAIHYPQLTALSVVTLANVDGTDAGWELYKDVTNKVEEAAIEGGYDKIEITGRIGWKKLMKPFGYELDYCTFSKEL